MLKDSRTVAENPAVVRNSLARRGVELDRSGILRVKDELAEHSRTIECIARGAVTLRGSYDGACSTTADSWEETMRKWQLLFAVVALQCLALAGTAEQHAPQGKPDHMHHRFDDPERYAKSFDDPARDTWQMPARIIEVLGLTPTMSVADIGAGTGYFSIRMAKVVPRGIVYAVDVEPSMLEHIRKRALGEHLPNIVTVQASGASPNLPNPVDV